MPYRAFETSDGDILLGGGNDRLFGIMCRVLGRPEWATDDRYINNSQRVKNRDVLESAIDGITATRTTEQWLDAFEGTGMPYAAVNDIQGALNHEHSDQPFLPLKHHFANKDAARARGMVQTISHPALGEIELVNTPVKYSETQPTIRTPPPMLGQHSDEVLQDLLGMKDEEIARLREEGIVA